MTDLLAEATRVRALDERDKAEMFRLYDRYYDAADRSRFDADLADKDIVVLVRDLACQDIVGFSTLSLNHHVVGDREIDYIFSGDTILDSSQWGNPALLKAWFRTVGSLSARTGGGELVWFLLVKGHRTFRILPNFFRRYVPSHDSGAVADLIRVRDEIASARYGAFFSRRTGVVDFGESLGHLRPEWAGVETAASRNRHAAEFLAANPDHFRGTELACLAELSRGNLKRYAATCFMEGATVRLAATTGCGE